MPEIDSKTWGIIAAALALGIAAGFILKPLVKPCGCQE